MRSRRNFSSTSAPFRCEWRPSRWLAGALALLGLLAAGAVRGCELETGIAWPASLVAMGWGLWLARREWRRPHRQLLIPSSPAVATIDGLAMETLRLIERGPLLILRWRQAGTCGQLLFWPDTLPRAQRRELRLAVRTRAVSR